MTSWSPTSDRKLRAYKTKLPHIERKTVQERRERGKQIKGGQWRKRKSYYSSLKGDHLSLFNSCLEQSDTKRVTLERWLKYIAPSTGPGQDSALCPTFTYTTKIGLLSWWAAKNGPTGLLARFKSGIQSPTMPGFFFFRIIECIASDDL